MRILLPIDGTDHSHATLEALLSRSWPADTQVEVLHVIPPGPESSHTLQRWRYARACCLTEKAVERIREALPALEVSAKVAAGSPRQAILKEAADWGADLILMGSHRHSVLNRLIRGSFARTVASRAPCEVVVAY